MKKIILFALVASIAFVGCKKDNDSTTASNLGDVTIASVKTSFTELLFNTYTEGTTKSYSITNYGSEFVTNEIFITLVDPIIGSNVFNDESNNSIKLAIGDKTYYSKTGTITIIKKDASSLTGTFTGTFTVGLTTTEVTASGNFISSVSSLSTK